MNKIAYLDDKQVVKLEVEKYYSQAPSTVVMIEEIKRMKDYLEYFKGKKELRF